ncbi:MAG TPA: MFS transporter [Polyangiales bacterium]|nr:MFS transporter [Polyangiales bacterium]
MDLSPLRRPNFRRLYAGQFVSQFGSMLSYVALPYAIYQSTKSTVLTGLLGVIQLLPSVFGGLFGGALADAFDRRRLIVLCEAAMALVVLALGAALSWRSPAYPDAPWLLLAAAALAVWNGVHRPALEALTPLLVERHEQPAVAVLSSLRYNVCAIGGPALAGVLIGIGGADLAFYLDAATFLAAIGCVVALRDLPRPERPPEFTLQAVHEGFRYAMSRQDLVGTYLVDIVAMTFSMPSLLFPAVADAFGSPLYLGWLHAGIAIGALIATLTTQRLFHSRRHGRMILIAAAAWSASMVGFGLATSFPLAMLCLILAGYADMISGVYRMTIWNQTIPTELRGRLAGIEMISYLSGPMLGNTQLGILAQTVGIQRAITLSSLLGLLGIAAVARFLPKFRGYEAK